MMSCSRISSRLPLLYSRMPPRSLCTLARYVELLFRNSTLHKGSSIGVHLFRPQAPPQAMGCTGALYVLSYIVFSDSAILVPACARTLQGRPPPCQICARSQELYIEPSVSHAMNSADQLTIIMIN